MKVFSNLRLALAAVAVWVSGCAGVPAHDGWVSLIADGKGLENFVRLGDANWRVESGLIVADQGKGGLLVTRDSYKDFQIRAEFWAASDTNSGIFIRASDPAKIAAASSYEVNIWDIRPDPRYGTGAIVDVAAVPVPLPVTVGGRWNVMEITAHGQHLTVRLNGQTTVDIRDGRFTQGPIALQYGPGVKGAMGGPIKWRTVAIKRL